MGRRRTENSYHRTFTGISRSAYIRWRVSREEVDLFSDDEAEEGTQPISHEDYKRLIKYLEKKNPPAILPIQIAYYAGLRIGETCGLTWQDINLEEQCLTIKRSMANYITAITTKNCI